MDLDKRIEFFSGMLIHVRSLTASHISTFVKPENLEKYLEEVEAQFTTFQDQLAALSKDCREKLAGIHEDFFAKFIINYRASVEAHQQSRKKSKTFEECEETLQDSREKIAWNNISTRKGAEKEYRDLRKYFETSCGNIFRSYQNAIIRIGKKYM